jgi:hypothetical protein
VPPSGTTVAFTHYAVVREILGMLLGLGVAVKHIEPGSVHQLRIDGSSVRMIVANDIDGVDGQRW